MKKPSHTPIARADLSQVTGAGLPSLWTLPIICAGYTADKAATAWGNQFSWKRPGPNGYE
jgi:hypothetical protein